MIMKREIWQHFCNLIFSWYFRTTIKTILFSQFCVQKCFFLSIIALAAIVFNEHQFKLLCLIIVQVWLSVLHHMRRCQFSDYVTKTLHPKNILWLIFNYTCNSVFSTQFQWQYNLQDKMFKCFFVYKPKIWRNIVSIFLFTPFW